MSKDSLINFCKCSILKTIFIPLHKEGIKFVLIFSFTTIILAMISSILGLIGLVLTIWCIFFFRDPERFIPQGKGLITSPADGVVTDVDHAVTAPEELGFSKNTKWKRIGIFLDVFDVHVNRVPIAGKITKLTYKQGEFLKANDAEANVRNERQSTVVKTANGQEVIFIQIAGLIARRIVCDLKEGQEVKTGERYGIIRFGSRADIYLPSNTKINALIGQTMIGGETIIAELGVAKSQKTLSKAPLKTSSKTRKVTKPHKKNL